jgi:hypothetical protein
MPTTLLAPPTAKVECRNCVHFREYPFGDGTVWKRKTGCYHPDLMVQKQSDLFLREQQVPGDHEAINLRGDCPKYEARPPQPTLLQRAFSAFFS